MNLKLVLSFFLFVWCGDVFAVPAQIVILRHAEKIETTNHLSPKGYKRANALVKFFANNPVMNRYGTPVAIYASYKEGASVRSIETMTPTAQYFNVRINKDFQKQDYKNLVDQILTARRYDGKTVIICWQHTNIINIINEFNADHSPHEWPDEVFDQTIVLDRLDAEEVRLKVIPQRLLPGDSK